MIGSEVLETQPRHSHKDQLRDPCSNTGANQAYSSESSCKTNLLVSGSLPSNFKTSKRQHYTDVSELSRKTNLLLLGSMTSSVTLK